MAQPMANQMAGLRERLPTFVTRIRLLASVNPPMDGQMGFLRKSGTTNLACERLLARVHSGVCRKMTTE